MVTAFIYTSKTGLNKHNPTRHNILIINISILQKVTNIWVRSL